MTHRRRHGGDRPQRIAIRSDDPGNGAHVSVSVAKRR
jgi:hypothetical protein